jgi:hypothetical protein
MCRNREVTPVHGFTRNLIRIEVYSLHSTWTEFCVPAEHLQLQLLMNANCLADRNR